MESKARQSMLAIRIREAGGPDVLEPFETPVPAPAADQVLIEVAAAGVNRPDILQREGRYPVPEDASPLPGLEVAGTVAAVGDGVHDWRVGDPVMALTHGGGYAAYAVANAGSCMNVPRNMTATEAAGVPETGLTVVYNVFMRSGLADGETLLVHGGSSGIGTMAIQLAKSRGCRVVTTAGSDEKCRFCEELGADLAINYRETEWSDVCREHLGGANVDVVLDMVAGDYVDRNLSLLRDSGRYSLIAFQGGYRTSIDLRPLVARRITLTGSTLRPRSVAEKTTIRDRAREILLPALATGQVKTVVDSTFPLAEAARAHRHMETGTHMGKIVLTTAAVA